MKVASFDYDLFDEEYPCEVVVDSFEPYIPATMGACVDSSFPAEGGEITYRVFDLRGREVESCGISIIDDERIRDEALKILQPEYF